MGKKVGERDRCSGVLSTVYMVYEDEDGILGIFIRMRGMGSKKGIGEGNIDKREMEGEW